MDRRLCGEKGRAPHHNLCQEETKKREADDFAAEAKIEVKQGTHTPSSKSITVAKAGQLWLATAGKNKLERTTIDGYKQHLTLHIEPFLGDTKLSDLSTPMVREFEDKLSTDKTTPRSPGLIKKVRGSLGAILADAQERGLVARNVVRELRSRRRRGKERRADRRQKVKIGVDIPSPAEIMVIIEAAEGRWRPFFLTAIFTGLRASELRGLRWADVDLKKGELNVTQRADAGDRRPKVGSWSPDRPRHPKACARPHRMETRMPEGGPGLGLSEHRRQGRVARQHHQPCVDSLQIGAGVTVQVKDSNGKLVRDEDGKLVLQAKYTGLHALRHFYASWCINRETDGGLELPAKVVQERLGHSSITVTLDTYGHLFPRGDDSAKLAEAESRLWG